MTVRSEQVASVIQRSVQQIISRGVNDPRVRGLISVTGVKLSPDLRQATIMVSVMPEEHATLTLHGLTSAARHIQRQLRELVELRRVPRVSFKLDDSIKRENRVLAAIDAERRRSDTSDPTPPNAEDQST
jgi:ribosome-binding factor A